jgi:hypothetical protein
MFLQGKSQRTCEYPINTNLVFGQLLWKLLTAVATAAVPCFAESPYAIPPQELCPPQAG